MTFSALSYLVWYKKHRQFIKDKVDAEDFESAESILINLIAEHKAKFVNDHSTNRSELAHLEHALEHIQVRGSNDNDHIKSKIPKILSYDPESFAPQD